jgi:hypothetical protein
MGNYFRKKGTTSTTLPLEGGGKRVGVKGLGGLAKRLSKQSTYPSPCPSPQREIGNNF